MTNNNTTSLLDQLRQGTVEVTFTKTDGSTRKMKATLSPEYVSETEIAGATTNFDQVNVWDLEANAWRSFRPSSVISIAQVA